MNRVQTAINYVWGPIENNVPMKEYLKTITGSSIAVLR